MSERFGSKTVKIALDALQTPFKGKRVLIETYGKDTLLTRVAAKPKENRRTQR